MSPDPKAQANEWIEARCSVNLSPAAMRSCVVEQVKAAEDQKRSERDLDAQESVARSTRAMMLAGWLGLIIGLGSVFLIWRTLRETQAMAVDATDAVAAAREANAIMRSEQRPWILPSHCEVALEVTADGNIPIRFYTIMKNYGTVPAQTIGAASGSSSDVSWFNSDNQPGFGDANGEVGVTAPGAAFTCQTGMIPEGEFSANRDNGKNLYFRTRVVYQNPVTQQEYEADVVFQAIFSHFDNHPSKGMLPSYEFRPVSSFIT